MSTALSTLTPAKAGGVMHLQTGQQGEFFRVTENGLIIVADTPEEEWLRLTELAVSDFEKTRDDHAAAMFRVGDALAYGDMFFHDTYGQAIDSTRKSIMLAAKTLQNAQWIAKNVKPENRHEMLSFSHHGEVAALPPEEQKEFLDRAEDEAWTVPELRRAIRERHPKQSSSGSGSTKKAVIDLDSEEGLLHAAEKVLEYFKAQEGTPEEWSKERVRQWGPIIAELVTYFAPIEQVARHGLVSAAAFATHNAPVHKWSDKRKRAWSDAYETLKEIVEKAA